MSVVIEVPSSRPAALPEPDGDPASIDALADTLAVVGSRYEEFGDEAVVLREIRTWSGEAFDRYRPAADRVAREHEAMARTVERVARAAYAHADTLRDLRRTWQGLVDRRDAIDEDRSTLIADIEATTDATETQIEALRTRARELGGRYDTLVSDHDALRRQVQANDDLLRQAFENGTDLDEALSETGGVNDVAADVVARPGAPGPGADPGDVRAWWDGLTDAEREAVVAAYPGLIGSADGLPAQARDDANRVLVEEDLAALRAKESDGTLDESERELLDNAEATEEALEAADAYSDPITGEAPGGLLWLYDPGAFDGDGRVAVAVGDPDTADDVSVQVPGITTEMTDVPSYTQQAINLYESVRHAGDGSSVATMFWLGYDTPESAVDVDTITSGRAEDGGGRLADALDGLRASRDDPAHLTVIGHSYGSTTTSYALGDHDVDVDEAVLIGSPGAGPAEDAGDLGVDDGHVWAGRNSRDLVGIFGDEGWFHTPGGLGMDPSSDDFGAQRFEAESAQRGGIRNIDDHSRYYDPDSESLYNLGRIVDGDPDAVNRADHTFDPWYDAPRDPEWDRDPTEDVPGASDTTAR